MSTSALHDLSRREPHAPRRPDFHALLGHAAWLRLPAAVRARFGADTHVEVTYCGVCTVHASLPGRWLAQLCRLIGTPVAPHVGEDVPMTVRVMDTAAGIVWERHYEFAGREPVVVRSTKQLDEDGTLIEAVNARLHMRLKVYETDGELHFLSTGYFFRVGPWRAQLPDWFLPGVTHVVHRDLGNDSFRFVMDTNHHWFGRMFFQDGVFRQGGVRSST
ncbi:DUF4166 domain-containing protein [Povalibacter sp.]|uniref:DUF4166 domain-containing protein n=1 Tax=Povalibacter sp. TaxID=1962978 RepID=UPI002F3F1562